MTCKGDGPVRFSRAFTKAEDSTQGEPGDVIDRQMPQIGQSAALLPAKGHA